MAWRLGQGSAPASGPEYGIRCTGVRGMGGNGIELDGKNLAQARKTISSDRECKLHRADADSKEAHRIGDKGEAHVLQVLGREDGSLAATLQHVCHLEPTTG